MSAFIGLQCHLCQTVFPAEALYVCDRCLGPLEPLYDYAAIHVTRAQIEARPKNLWRYRELLPISGEPRSARGGRALHQGRFREPSDAVLQGPRRIGGGDARR